MAKKKGDRIGTEIKKMAKALNEKPAKIKKKGPSPEDIFRQMTGKEANPKGAESSDNDFDNIPYKDKVVEERKKEHAAKNKNKAKSESSSEVYSSDEPTSDDSSVEDQKESKSSISSFDDLLRKKYKIDMSQFTENKERIKKKGKEGEVYSEDESNKRKGEKHADSKRKQVEQKNNENYKAQKGQPSKNEPIQEEFQGNKVWGSYMYSDEDVKKKKPSQSYGTAEEMFRKRMEQRNSGELLKEDNDLGGGGDAEEEEEEEVVYEEDEEDDEEGYTKGAFKIPDDKVRFVSKSMWGGGPPRFTKPLEHPIKIIRRTYTGTDLCYDMEVCAPILKQLEEKARKVMNLPDLQWNFVIGSDGTIYEGRGWNVEGYKNKDCRRKYGGVSVLELGYMGNFKDSEVPHEMTFAETVFLRQATKKGYVEKMHTVTPMYEQ